ncbi:MAG: DNA repair protein RecO (recombination protein O) [Paracoccaceae bacterium]|jgi:DNA repair protein RecO (recombination protein O)
MDWQDEGTILSSKPHGESSAIVELFCRGHGRHLGVVRGGASRKMAALLQIGNQVKVAWRARLESHMGNFVLEPLKSRASLMEGALTLAGLTAICAMLRVCLAERQAQPKLWLKTAALLKHLETAQDWPVAYLRWEALLLDEIGFGLDLTQCAVTGNRENLLYVSPKTGRAISPEGAGDWASRLLPLPSCLLGQGPALADELVRGLDITGYFLEKALQSQAKNHLLPEARGRLIAIFSREPEVK